MIVRLANPAYRGELERFLVQRGCRVCPTSEDELDVEVQWPHEAMRFATVDRAKILSALGDWRRMRPTAEAELVDGSGW